MAQPSEAVPEPAAGVNEITVAVVVPDGDQVTGAGRQTGRRVQRTVNFDRDVLERARAAATYLAAYEATAGVRSLADIVNPAVAAYVAELERRYNDGEAFRPVIRMPPGRPARRAPAEPPAGVPPPGGADAPVDRGAPVAAPPDDLVL